MNKRLVILSSAVIVVVALALGSAALAFRGAHDEGADRSDSGKPGVLDDGKELVPKTKVTLARAVAAARQAASGKLGQVDLESEEGRVFYEVDVGDREVRVDAVHGHVLAIERQS